MDKAQSGALQIKSVGSEELVRLKGIADVVEQRGKPPVLKKNDSGFVVVGKVIELLERLAVILVGIIDGEPQRKDINRVGIMVAMLHQQRRTVRLKLRKQLDHLLTLAIVTEEDLQIAVIDVVRILGDTRVDKMLQLALEAQAVDIHLHIIGYLVFTDAVAGKNPCLKLTVLVRVKF